MSPTAHPLVWPVGRPRTTHRKTASFNKRADTGQGYTAKKELSIADARERLQKELDLLRATHIVLSTNVELRLDGTIRSVKGAEPADPGAALYFQMRGKQTTLACDQWDRVADNIVAIAKHIEALRGMDRWGVGTLDQAFAGFQMLAAPDPWWRVLELSSDQATESQIRAAHRNLIIRSDIRGSESMMARVNVARDEGLKINGY